METSIYIACVLICDYGDMSTVLVIAVAQDDPF